VTEVLPSAAVDTGLDSKVVGVLNPPLGPFTPVLPAGRAPAGPPVSILLNSWAGGGIKGDKPFSLSKVRRSLFSTRKERRSCFSALINCNGNADVRTAQVVLQIRFDNVLVLLDPCELKVRLQYCELG